MSCASQSAVCCSHPADCALGPTASTSSTASSETAEPPEGFWTGGFRGVMPRGGGVIYRGRDNTAPAAAVEWKREIKRRPGGAGEKITTAFPAWEWVGCFPESGGAGRGLSAGTPAHANMKQARRSLQVLCCSLLQAGGPADDRRYLPKTSAMLAAQEQVPEQGDSWMTEDSCRPGLH